MRKPIRVVVLVFTALAAVLDIGSRLAGAMRQVGALAGANAGSAAIEADPEVARGAARGEPVPVARSAPDTGAAAEQPAPTGERHAPEGEPPQRFDTVAALREAGDRDTNVAELMNDPDPAVGNAVRDFITSLAQPGNDQP